MEEQNKNNSSDQPFEKHEELSAILYHAAHVWKTDLQWSPLLSEINSLCTRIVDLQQENMRLASTLHNISISCDGSNPHHFTAWTLAHEALKPKD